MRRTTSAVCAAFAAGSLLLAVSSVAAQDAKPLVAEALTSTIPELPILASIEAAEAEAARFPRSNPDPFRTTLFLTYAGSAERTCVRLTPSRGAERVGDFVVGIRPAPPGIRTKVWWISAHDPTLERNALLVRGARLRADGPGPDTLRYTNATYVYQNVRSTPVPRFHPVHEGTAHLGIRPDDSFMFPSSGEWLLISTSGSDWSCAIVNVGRPAN